MKKKSGKTRRKATPSRGRRKTLYDEEASREEPVLGTIATEETNQDEGTALEPGKSAPEKKKTKPEMAFEKFAVNTVQKKMEGLKAEFMSLATYVPPDVTTNAFALNKERNRYNNIVCYDHSRAVLKYLVPPECDYIHANWISDTTNIKLGDCKYVCSQAPTDATVNDFWRLLWQEKIKHIIMLCKIIENGKVKCAQYWPVNVGETKQYGTVTVTHVKPATAEKEHVFESSIFQVSVGAETYTLHQHRWNNWPDFGVPESGMGMLRLLRIVRDSKKILIHCSAGVGRTGTVMAVEIILRGLLEGRDVSPFDVLRDLRSQRAGSIQTENQYLFVHKTIFEYLHAKKLSKSEVAAFNAAYQAVVKAESAPGQPHTPPCPAPPAAPAPPALPPA